MQLPLLSQRKKKLSVSLHLLDETVHGDEFRRSFATHLRTPFKWAK